MVTVTNATRILGELTLGCVIKPFKDRISEIFVGDEKDIGAGNFYDLWNMEDGRLLLYYLDEKYEMEVDFSIALDTKVKLDAEFIELQDSEKIFGEKIFVVLVEKKSIKIDETVLRCENKVE